MRRLSIIFSSILLISVLAACGSDEAKDNLEELPTLDVEFDVPEKAELDETIALEVFVTYDDEPEDDADVVFEVWESGQQDESEMLDGMNQGEGIYTVDYTFENEAVYEMYAHTDAEGLHTMPKVQIVVGDAKEAEHSDSHYETEGFDMHFNTSNEVNKNEDTILETHIMLNEEAFENLAVRYEVVFEGDADNTVWIDAEEDEAGAYQAVFDFPEAGSYDVIIHVEDDEELHEHDEYEVIAE